MAESLGSAVLELRTDSSKFNRGIDRARGKLDKLGKGFAQVGRALAGFGTVVTGVAALTIKMATDFNESMANVATLIPGNIDRVNELKDAVQGLAVAHGKDTADLAKGLYQTISAFGDQAGQTVKILEINSRAAAAGLAETTQAVDLTSAVTKAYGDTSAEAVGKVADLALLTVRLGQTDFPALARSMGKVTPIAEAMGQSQEDLFAVFATATGVVGKASEVSTQYRGILASLLDPSEDMIAVFGEMDVETGKAALAQEGLVGVLQKVVEAAERSGQPITKYISQIEAVPLALALAGPQADTFAEKLAAMGMAAGTSEEAFLEMTGGVNKFGFQMDVVRQQLVVLAQDIGDTLIPVASELLTIIQELVSGAGGTESLAESFRANLGPAINISSEVVLILTRAWTGFEFVIRTITGLLGTFIGVTLGGLFKALETVTAGILAMSDILVGLGKMTPENANKIRDMQVALQGLSTDGFDFASGSMALMKEEIIGQLDAQSDLERKIKSVTERLTDAANVTTQKAVPAVEAFFGALDAGAFAVEGHAQAVENVTRKSKESAQQAQKLAANTSKYAKAAKEAAEESAGFFQNLAGGIPILDGFGKSLDGIIQGITGGNGLSGFFNNLGAGLVEGLGQILSGGISSLINAGIGLAVKGLKALGGKILGFFGGLFGGPDAAELESRKIAASLNSVFASVLTEQDKIIAGNEQWKISNIGINRIYEAAGKTMEEAAAIATRLAEAVRQSPQQAQAVIDEITAVHNAGMQSMEKSSSIAAASVVEFQADVTASVTKTTQEIASTAARAAQSVSDSFRNLQFEIPVNFNIGDLPKGTGQSGATSSTGNVPRLARGGIVKKKTFAMIGEKGNKEAVIPLNKRGGLSGGMMQPIVIEIDGERLGEVTLDMQSRVLRALGIE